MKKNKSNFQAFENFAEFIEQPTRVGIAGEIIESHSEGSTRVIDRMKITSVNLCFNPPDPLSISIANLIDKEQMNILDQAYMTRSKPINPVE